MLGHERRDTVLGLVLCLVHLPANAAVPPDLETRARAIVEEERAIGGTLAMSVAIFADGQVIALFATAWPTSKQRFPQPL
jgi:hypothetical protein